MRNNQAHSWMVMLIVVMCSFVFLLSAAAEDIGIFEVPRDLLEIHDDEFAYDPSIHVLRVHSGVSIISIAVNYQLPNLQRYDVDEASMYFTSADGVLYSKDMKQLIAYPPGKQDKSFIVPDQVKYIGEMAFHGNTCLEQITLGQNTTHIMDCAFRNCSNLAMVHMNDALLCIGREAFANTAVSAVSFPNSLQYIGTAAFQSTRLSTVELPPSLLVIGAEAFVDCIHLQSIDIPASVIYLVTPICGWNHMAPDKRIDVYVCAGSYASVMMKTNDSVIVYSKPALN